MDTPKFAIPLDRLPKVNDDGRGGPLGLSGNRLQALGMTPSIVTPGASLSLLKSVTRAIAPANTVIVSHIPCFALAYLKPLHRSHPGPTWKQFLHGTPGAPTYVTPPWRATSSASSFLRKRKPLMPMNSGHLPAAVGPGVAVSASSPPYHAACATKARCVCGRSQGTLRSGSSVRLTA